MKKGGFGKLLIILLLILLLVFLLSHCGRSTEGETEHTQITNKEEQQFSKEDSDKEILFGNYGEEDYLESEEYTVNNGYGSSDYVYQDSYDTYEGDLFWEWFFGTEDTYGDYAYGDYTYAGAYGTEGTDLQITGLRKPYVDTASADSAVIMVYMIGSDLESMNGCATEDLEEMFRADLGGDVKIVLQTGGARRWYTSGISSRKRQRWVMEDDGMELVKEVGSGSMIDESSLTEFITWTARNYPADRYSLIFWDHGGGTMNGFGYDEVRDEGSLSLVDLADAIRRSGVKFDFIGFDACLMATLETAYVLEPYADYMIASEEYEPGGGWYYTDFLTYYAENVSMDTEELGKLIIDDFAQYYGNRDVTLSLISLREVPYVCRKLESFLDNAEDAIRRDNDSFRTMSMARSNAREYCNGQIDQVDILDLVKQTDFRGREELIDALKSCVKYYNNSSLSGSYGLAMYFPYEDLSSYSSMRHMFSQMDFDATTDFYNYFLSIMAGGQSRGGGNRGFISSEDADYFDEEWYEESINFEYGEEYEELYLEETEQGFELFLSDEEWERITDIRLAVMAYYEDGYLDLGTDNLAVWTEEGNLLLDFDYYWLCINGNPIAFYADKIYENSRATIYSGRTYAILNGEELIEVELEWEPVFEDSDADPQGFVKGYRIVNEDIKTEAKGLLTLREGDRISFLFDFYSEDGEFVDSYEFGDVITVQSQEELQVAYEELENMDVLCWYELLDIYQQTLYTETVEITWD